MQNLSAQPKTAVITGVSRRLGLGYAVARQLAERSYHVFLAARDARQAEQLAVELREAGHGATSLILDLASQSSTSQAADRLGELIGHLDVLVNNASAMPDFNTRSALEIDPGTLRTQFDVSVFGTWYLTQALLPLLRQAPAARIVNITSAAAGQIGKGGGGPIFSPGYPPRMKMFRGEPERPSWVRSPDGSIL
jgi:NAD(P)-dependent dehydrogenase (short-subunit alcohol dehydrogenase family)